MYISLEKELGLYFIAILLCKLSCLTTSPLFLCSITSLINNHLNLLFGTQGRPRRQSLFSLPTRAVLPLGILHRILLGFSPSSFPQILLSPEGIRQDKEGKKVLDREFNHKLSRKLSFKGLDFKGLKFQFPVAAITATVRLLLTQAERQLRGSLLPSPLCIAAPISASPLPSNTQSPLVYLRHEDSQQL